MNYCLDLPKLKSITSNEYSFLYPRNVTLSSLILNEYWIDIPNVETINLPNSFGDVRIKSITSIYMTDNEWIDVHDSLSQLSCLKGKILITIVRTCGGSPYEESFDIYVVNSSTDSLFHQGGCLATTTTLYICPVVHTIVMRDSGYNGWSSGSKVTLRYQDQSYTYYGPSKSSYSRSETFQFVYIFILLLLELKDYYIPFVYSCLLIQ